MPYAESAVLKRSRVSTDVDSGFLEQLQSVRSGSPEGSIDDQEADPIFSGDEYDRAIKECASIAKSDFKDAREAVNKVREILGQLSEGLDENVKNIEEIQPEDGISEHAREVRSDLSEVKKTIEDELAERLRELRSHA